MIGTETTQLTILETIDIVAIDITQTIVVETIQIQARVVGKVIRDHEKNLVIIETEKIVVIKYKHDHSQNHHMKITIRKTQIDHTNVTEVTTQNDKLTRYRTTLKRTLIPRV